MSNDLTIIPSDHGNVPGDIERSISTINAPLSGFLEHVGLPTEDLLSPIDERRKVIQSLESVLEVLDPENRSRATYISKFTICVTVGLFDGALSFLWDETVKALRNKIVGFDIDYFYSIAESISSRYRGLSDPDDISAIGEHDLLEISRRIGLIDDVNHRRLDTVNYFRNHASAAHPNENRLSGIELLGFLENCLRYAICAEVEHSVIQVKRFLDNVRQQEIPASDYPAIWTQIERLPRQRIEDILQTLFGLHADPRIDQIVVNNVRGLAPRIWEFVRDDLRFKLGAKFGYYRANGDVDRRNRVQEFLAAVDGNAYKDEDSLGAELTEKLQHLRNAHYSMDNFYNEYPHAQAISQSLPPSGIPRSARFDFVKVITTCAIGNGYGHRIGVDENALPIYLQCIGRFGEPEIATFVSLFTDHEFIGDLHREKAAGRAKSLCNHLRSKASSVLTQNVLDILIQSSAIDRVHNDYEYKTALAKLS